MLIIAIFAFAEVTDTEPAIHSPISEVSQRHSDEFCSPPPTRAECKISKKVNPRCNGVHINYSDDPSNVGADYSVYREAGSNNYSVDVPIIFDFKDIPGDPQVLAREWTTKANSCLKSFKPHLSDGRRRLHVNVVNKTSFNTQRLQNAVESVFNDYPNGEIKDGEQFANEVDRINKLYEIYDGSTVITIHDSYDRANSKNWPKDIDCSVITHEVLHLTGLCDHYKESSMKYQPNSVPMGIVAWTPPEQTKYDCRPEYVGPNLMKNQGLYDPDSYFRQPRSVKRYREIVAQGPPPANQRYSNRVSTCHCPDSMGNAECSVSIQAAEQPREDPRLAILNCYENGIEPRDNQPTQNIFSAKPSKFKIFSKSDRSITIGYPGADRLKEYQFAKELIASIDNPNGLNPHQVEAILHPLCMTNPNSRAFYEVAVNAYRDRFTERGCAR